MRPAWREPCRRILRRDVRSLAHAHVDADEAADVTGANLLVDGGYSSVMGANQFQVPWHLWNVPAAIGETYPGMAPLPDSFNQQGIPGVHFPIPDRT